MVSSIYKKPAILSFMVFFLAIAASAQIQIGIKGGLSAAEIMTTGRPTTIVSGNDQNLRLFPFTTVPAGVFFSIPLVKKLYLQPEIVYSMQGATGKPETNYLYSVTEDYRFSYINVPILLKYKLAAGFFAETGPQVGFLMSAKINETRVGSVNTFHYNVKDQLKSTDLSWALGAGYCSPFNVGLDIRYNLGLNNINQATAQGLTNAPLPNGSMKNSVFQLTVFYIFGKKLFNPPVVSE